MEYDSEETSCPYCGSVDVIYVGEESGPLEAKGFWINDCNDIKLILHTDNLCPAFMEYVGLRKVEERK